MTHYENDEIIGFIRRMRSDVVQLLLFRKDDLNKCHSLMITCNDQDTMYGVINTIKIDSTMEEVENEIEDGEKNKDNDKKAIAHKETKDDTYYCEYPGYDATITPAQTMGFNDLTLQMPVKMNEIEGNEKGVVEGYTSDDKRSNLLFYDMPDNISINACSFPKKEAKEKYISWFEQYSDKDPFSVFAIYYQAYSNSIDNTLGNLYFEGEGLEKLQADKKKMREDIVQSMYYENDSICGFVLEAKKDKKDLYYSYTVILFPNNDLSKSHFVAITAPTQEEVYGIINTIKIK